MLPHLYALDVYKLPQNWLIKRIFSPSHFLNSGLPYVLTCRSFNLASPTLSVMSVRACPPEANRPAASEVHEACMAGQGDGNGDSEDSTLDCICSCDTMLKVAVITRELALPVCPRKLAQPSYCCCPRMSVHAAHLAWGSAWHICAQCVPHPECIS